MLLCMQVLSDASGRLKLNCVALAIIKGKAVALETLFPRYGETCGRVEATAEEANRCFGRSILQSLQYRFGSRQLPPRGPGRVLLRLRCAGYDGGQLTPMQADVKGLAGRGFS
jgi:hypothetical protein